MQKIMEPIFEIAYLLFALIIGIYFLVKFFRSKEKNYEVLLVDIMILLLGGGDSFHLIPRMIGLLGDGLENHVFSLGLGKLITSITMTIFYVIFYYVLKIRYKKKVHISLDITIILVALTRIILCCFPQNQWFEANPSYLWAMIRNIPFWLLGAMFVVISFLWCKKDKYYRFTPLLVLLSFGFYTVTVALASTYSWTGMMMIPKTICYVGIIVQAIFAYKNID